MTTCEETIEAKLESLHPAIDFISNQALLAKCPSESLWDIQLACEEAIMNIIEHGYQKTLGTIQISCSHNTSSFTIMLSDMAAPFDPTQELTPSNNQFRGNGIKLMKHLVDEIRYANIENRNVLTLKKMISACNS